MAQAPETLDFITVALTPEFKEDPYPFFHRLRELEPVQHTPLGTYMLSRYADVSAVVRDPALSSDQRNSDLFQAYVEANPPGEGTFPDPTRQATMLFLDPPDHTRLRGLVSKAFTPRVIGRLRPRIEQLVDELLGAVASRGDGHMDVVADLAYPLPVVIICELLGVPHADHATFQEWSRDLVHSIDPDPLITPEQWTRIEAAGAAFVEYFVALIEERRRSPGDDLLSGLIAAEEAGDRLSEEELLATALLLLVAGHETTVNLIGNGTLALLRNRDQLERLRDDPALDHNAVEEMLRYDSPVTFTQRITLAEYRVGDVTIPPRQQVVTVLAAANRDPDAFPDPDRLDLGRPEANRHVAFGGGHHYCLGAALARLEGEVAIPTLVRRFPALELAGDPTRRDTFTLRGLERLPVGVGAA
ncbi:MAG TPA: cytochrome P450 [Acidimicrobiia bacterium]